MNANTTKIKAYHQRTKHTLQRYAKGPETIDWDDQPDPFRHFAGCAHYALPPPGQAVPVLFTELDQPQTITAQPLSLASVGLLLELSFGLSCWKGFDTNRWALRCNPSSGNLHPTEAYLITTNQQLIPAGVYHYLSYEHSLEQRCQFHEPTTAPALFIGLSSIHWREAWKYGERAFRYCQHDIGHALGALRYAAASLGWSIDLLCTAADADIASLLGLNRQTDFKPKEHESPDVLCRIQIPAHAQVDDIDVMALLATATWFGTADSLRAYHLYDWPIIDEVTQACEKPKTHEVPWLTTTQLPLPSHCEKTASQIIRQRRSAQQFDGKMPPLASEKFFRILSATLPNAPAFSFWQMPPKVDLFIFVHRVDGLAPGLYVLLRDSHRLPALQQACLDSFRWDKHHDDLAFYQLDTGDLKLIAKTLSCHQPIASDSAFSLAMVADFEATLATAPWQYRRLFWECGLIGQILYLEAEAAEMRGTGIGCYFDDSVHECLGFNEASFQSLYHFTIGKARDDQRLQTSPAYGHLQFNQVTV